MTKVILGCAGVLLAAVVVVAADPVPTGKEVKNLFGSFLQQAITNAAKSSTDYRTQLLNTAYTWSDNGTALGTITFTADGAARLTWSGMAHVWRIDSNGELVINGGGTTFVTRLTYVPADGSFNGVRDRTSQVQDGVKSVMRPVANAATKPSGPGNETAWDHTTTLTAGWDIFNAPLVSGQVRWSIRDGAAGQKHFVVSYELRGAEANHRYTAGVHFFEPVGQAQPEVDRFGGWKVGGKEGLARDNVNATVLAAWDFGTLATDARGDGGVRFEYDIPARSYFMQFTLRTGECRPAQGVTSGCSIVYRTGRRAGDGFEEIKPTTVISTDNKTATTGSANRASGAPAATGLLGEYFANRNCSGSPAIKRIDPNINFDWGYGSPGDGVPVDNFSARWTAQIQPRYSDTYVFTGNRDNGFRLWIDGQLLVDLWNNEWGSYESRPIALQADRRYDLKVEYYEDYGGAAVSLKWKSPHQAEEIVPNPCLFPGIADHTGTEPRPPVTNIDTTNQRRDKFDRTQWFATRGSWNNRFGEGSAYDDSAIEIEGDAITLKADRTDQVAALYSRPIALSRGDILTIKRSVFVHAASRKFEGGITAYAVDDPGMNANKPNFQDNLFNLGYRNFDYETDQNLFCLCDGRAMPPGPGKYSGGTAPTTTPLWDQWFDEELRYDSGSGETVYKINGRECMRYRSAPLGKPYVKLLMHPYGWGTGHLVKMKNFEISVSSSRASVGGGSGQGQGLLGTYFANRDCSGSPVITRIDPAINFDWGDGSPGNGVPVDSFSARWTGQIQPRYSETYVFSGHRDNGYRLWIDGQLLVDLWNNEWGDYASRPIALQANRRYDLKVEYYEDYGGAAVSLKWKSPHQAEEIVPTSALFATNADNTTTGNANDPQRNRPPSDAAAGPLLSSLIDLKPMQDQDPVGSGALFSERESARYRILFQKQPDMLPLLAATLASARLVPPPGGVLGIKKMETAEAQCEVDGALFTVTLIKVNGQWKIISL